MFRLTKMTVLDGQSSSVRQGTTVYNKTLGKVTRNNEDYTVTECKLDDLAINDEVLLGNPFFGGIKTSAISEIVDKLEDRLIFKTRTSLYVLEEIEGKKELQ